MRHRALYFDSSPDGRVKCRLCPRQCVIRDGASGFCGVRRNRAGVLHATTYGTVASVAMDPIEKKPLYHFLPGSDILSLGQTGCTLHCEFCQNWKLLDPGTAHDPLSPEDAVVLARARDSVGIAYTYNEPFVGFEYVLDTARRAREAGLVNVLVTNGYYMPEPFAELAPFVDAMNIDLKSVRNDFYVELAHGSLAPVQRTIEEAVRRGIHVELTNLLVTGWNDSAEDVQAWVDYVAGVSADVPVHFSRYHPAYRMDDPPTPVESLRRAFEIASKRLRYVYVGNVSMSEGRDSACPECAAALVRREGFEAEVVGLRGSACASCGAALNFVVSD